MIKDVSLAERLRQYVNLLNERERLCFDRLTPIMDGVTVAAEIAGVKYIHDNKGH